MGDEIEEAENEAEDACCDDDSPERKTELLLRGSVLVEVTKHLTSHDDQSKCQGDQSGLLAQQRPVASIPALEKAQLGDDQEYADCAGHEVADAVEEEEVGVLDCLDEHDPAGRDDGSECDDAEDADDVEDYVASTGKLEVFEHGKWVEHGGGCSRKCWVRCTSIRSSSTTRIVDLTDFLVFAAGSVCCKRQA